MAVSHAQHNAEDLHSDSLLWGHRNTIVNHGRASSLPFDCNCANFVIRPALSVSQKYYTPR
ncbi:hypothetical protein N7478_010081 [Penicillium angulare]|uniref:uncharacterized protein n=1 Tax=Penicillium angulare TaxID=116970 RepID=UPI0025415CD9|nr:uncharacterized protein N7478_010081 [Penicillium angulare]KAJ5267273.1 hypothetical protein N7478_010081 [Penicillium angulare]